MAEADRDESFDPYLKWLGIRDKTRPVNYYRLLGIELFEEDPEVIGEAADRQMGHVRTHQTGRYSQASQQLLNELARAKVCLLNAGRREEYNTQLRLDLNRGRAIPPVAGANVAPPPIPPPLPPPSSSPVPSPAIPPVIPTPGNSAVIPPPIGPPPLGRMHLLQTTLHDPGEDTPPSGIPKPPPPAKGRPSPLTIRLHVLEGESQGEVFEYSGRGSFTVGRGQQAGFLVKGDQALSRVHFKIRLTPPNVFLDNLNDRQGTRINERVILDTSVLLHDGDQIRAGLTTVLRVEIVKLASAKQEAVSDDGAGTAQD